MASYVVQVFHIDKPGGERIPYPTLASARFGFEHAINRDGWRGSNGVVWINLISKTRAGHIRYLDHWEMSNGRETRGVL